MLKFFNASSCARNMWISSLCSKMGDSFWWAFQGKPSNYDQGVCRFGTNLCQGQASHGNSGFGNTPSRGKSCPLCILYLTEHHDELCHGTQNTFALAPPPQKKQKKRLRGRYMKDNFLPRETPCEAPCEWVKAVWLHGATAVQWLTYPMTGLMTICPILPPNKSFDPGTHEQRAS